MDGENSNDLERKICVKLSQMMHDVEKSERKINKMIDLAETLKNGDENKEFLACMDKLKNDHENLKKRFTDFVDSYHFEDSFTVVKTQIKAFIKQQDDNIEKINEVYIKHLSAEHRRFLDSVSDKDQRFREFRDRFLNNIKGSSSNIEEQKGSLPGENISINIQGLEEKLQGLMVPGGKSKDKREASMKMVPPSKQSDEQPKIDMDKGRRDETKNEICENYKKDGNKSLTEWLKLHKQGNKDWKVMNEMRVSVVDLGSRLSQLLYEFMILMPEHEDKLKTFKTTLEELAMDGNAKVVEKMVNVIEMVNNEVSGEKKDKEIHEPVEEHDMDEFFNQVFEVILHLENVVSFHSLPHSSELTEGSESILKYSLNQCEKQLEEIGRKVNEFKKLLSYDVESEKSKNLKLRIVVMWDELKREEVEEQSGKEKYNYTMQKFLKM